MILDVYYNWVNQLDSKNLILVIIKKEKPGIEFLSLEYSH